MYLDNKNRSRWSVDLVLVPVVLPILSTTISGLSGCFASMPTAISAVSSDTFLDFVLGMAVSRTGPLNDEDRDWCGPTKGDGTIVEPQCSGYV